MNYCPGKGLILPGHTIPLTPISSDDLKKRTKYYIRPIPFDFMRIGTYVKKQKVEGKTYLKFKKVKFSRTKSNEPHNFNQRIGSERYEEESATYYERLNNTIARPRLLARILEKFNISTHLQHSDISSRISDYISKKGGRRTKRRSRKSKSTVKNYKK
jgi:hypothetical protein